MNAAEAYRKATSDEVRAKVKAERDRQIASVMSGIIREINDCIRNGYTGFRYHANNEYYGFSKWEKLALEELKKEGFKVTKGWWPINNTTRKISWEHAKPVPANDVIKGML